jgi:LysM repeat protein
VEAGNTLFAIALAVNSTVRELQRANCLDNADVIKAGQVLYLPRLPIRPVTTAASGAGHRPVLGCLSGDALIVSPIRGQRLRNVFAVQGTAFRSDFWYYKLEVRREGVEIYDFYSDSQTPVVNGTLGEIDASRFGTGEYWVRLSVVDLAGRILPDMFCEIPVVFE